MLYRLAADALVVIHFGFIIFVALGAFLVWRWPRLAWIHLPAAAWGILIEFVEWTCPLTPLENHWRHVAGQAGYEGGFVAHYVIPLVYPPGLTPALQAVLGTIVLFFNAFVYTIYFGRRRLTCLHRNPSLSDRKSDTNP
ncbi:MAG: hypothetical protein AMS18_00590 [Gemmatimonas sp. SG8_17]|nr:MAG: hypothetical protein AMS18_00590 [Gemmatimonas sp. SG8_17]